MVHFSETQPERFIMLRLGISSLMGTENTSMLLEAMQAQIAIIVAQAVSTVMNQ